MFERMLRVALAGALVLTVAGAVPAAAKDGDVIRRGACSGLSDWKLKLSPEDGRIEVEYEVDSNRAGQTWRVRLFQNGDRIFAGSKVTQPPSGSFTVRVLARNTAGTDSFRARATNVATGEVCGGSAAIG
ncbi:MAG TPA: hypothetical protein VF235_02875 [Actinomycetota bacterium]